MQNLDYILKLFEAKGWYLYEGNPKTSFDRIISRGRALQIKHDAFYHIMPSSGRDDDPDDLSMHIANAKRQGSTPKYDDKANRANIHAVYASNSEVSFASDTDPFTFPLTQVSDIVNGIQ